MWWDANLETELCPQGKEASEAWGQAQGAVSLAFILHP